MDATEIAATQGAGATIAPVIEALARVAAQLSARIARGPLGGSLGAAMGSNADGDSQKALDLMADRAFAEALKGTGVRFFASEEREAVAEIDADGRYALVIDPLDGSSNIDVNVSIGTIFGLYEVAGDAMASCLRPGRELIAAGYFIYGPQTALVLSTGDGVELRILDRASGAFQPAGRLQVPAEANEFAINASNYRHWPAPVRSYIDDCLAGADGPRHQSFNMRWIASLVAETHRIMVRGGVFLYPGDSRKGYAQGRLRLVYECGPIAFLVEQAGGQATDGTRRILDLPPAGLHARSPFVFGSADNVRRVTAYHDLPDHEVSALFCNRGLFRG